MDDIDHDTHSMRAFVFANVVGPAPPLPRFPAMMLPLHASHGAVCCRAEQNKTRNLVP